MLTRLLPDQISKFWDIIHYAVEQSLPPTVGEHPDKMNRILAAALSGKIEVWASYTRGEEGAKFEGIVLTKILFDDASQTRNLLIYCLYGYEAVDGDSWMNGLETIAKFAKSRDCASVIAYSDKPEIIEIAKKLGAQARYTYLTFDLSSFNY